MAIKTNNIHRNTPGRYKVITFGPLSTGTGDTTGNLGTTWPFATKGVIKNAVVVVHAAGTGTSYKITLKKNDDGAIFATGATFTVADGVAAMDTAGAIAKPTNGTRPVLGTTANCTLSQGDKVTFDVDVTSISAAGTFSVQLVVDPIDGKQVASY